MREKATAARPPANSPPLAVVPAPAAAAAAPTAAPTLASIGQQLRELVPSRRLHSVSVWDGQANVMWLSEGALGPDEQSVVVAALEVLADDPSAACHEDGLEDGRFALFLPVRAPTGQLVGAAMILADSKSVGDDTQERLSLAPVRAIMQRLAVLLKPGDRKKAENGRANGAELADLPEAVMPLLELVPDLEPAPEAPAHGIPTLPAAPPAKASAPSPRAPAPPPKALAPSPKAAAPRAAAATLPTMTPEEVNDILEFEPSPEIERAPAQRTNGSPVESTVSESDMVSLDFLPTELRAQAAAAPVRRAASVPTAAAVPRVPAAQTASSAKREALPPPLATAAAPQGEANLTLEVLPYAKLRAGGQARRFEVQARLSPRVAQADPAVLDVLILQRLLGWLAAHRTVWNSQPTSFSVPVSIATLEDESFGQKVAAELNSHGIAAETLALEITEAVCTQRRAQVERFLTQCDKLGVAVVIDDFSFDSQVLPLLRSKAVRLLKIEPRLTASALKDKLSQALVIASVQAAKVLGIHCSAKRIESQAAAQWLGAVGCDFGQGAVFASAKSLDALAASPDAMAVTTLVDRRTVPRQ